MNTVKATAAAGLAAAMLMLTACGGSTDNNAASTPSDAKATTSAPAASPSAAAPAAPKLPTADQLAKVLGTAVDPAVPTAQKTGTVVGGEEAPELFQALTQIRQESGATMTVVEPVLPSLLPGAVQATVSLQLPDQPPNVVSGVEFVNARGTWKLDRKWACDLVRNVLPDRVPPMCEAL